MSGYDLSMDMEALRTLADDLDAICAELSEADDVSEVAAHATGHDALADRVRDFADKWRVKREDMLGDVTKLRDAVMTIAENFTQVDADLAKALEEKVAG
ncbi:hypothetical protein GCM10025865_05500 [Paraoerskovia sediminicola]|uniref:WXG100 family type VII secretion target n=1 Tax=Paraoerskovia sediminicola TaxID=1138587 RepID=A0ABM8FZV2_9CELL|nr:hypothetical protein [Paraoerskovia sediminicola]BDZ41251.1 hypothetical protein GCM10025865_05500 [Paraoerskovia sediminicola]